MNVDKLDEIIKESADAFMNHLAKSLPEISTGDLSPSDEIRVEILFKDAAYTWIRNNAPESSIITGAV